MHLILKVIESLQKIPNADLVIGAIQLHQAAVGPDPSASSRRKCVED